VLKPPLNPDHPTFPPTDRLPKNHDVVYIGARSRIKRPRYFNFRGRSGGSRPEQYTTTWASLHCVHNTSQIWRARVQSCINEFCNFLDITWRDKVTNEEVRKRTGQEHLEKVIRERRMRWLGHVMRMDEVRIPKQALHWEVQEKTWQTKDELERFVKKDVQRMGLTWESAQADIRGVNVWPCALVMLDESRSRSRLYMTYIT